MTPSEAAEALNGNQYREEGSRELFNEMKQNRLVAVFGASDDLMEFRGAINDEIGAWEGATVWVTKEEYVHDFKTAGAWKIDALWCEEKDISWTYKTTIPHKTFLIMEDDDVYCRGIVFSLDRMGSLEASK